MLTVTYNPVKIYDWLSARERKGLDVEGTLDRFEGKVRKELMRWAHVEGVHFERTSGVKTKITPQKDALDQMYAQISLLFVDCHFFRYKDANAHVKALIDTEYHNLRVSLIEDVAEAYDIPRAVADLIYSLRGKRVVDQSIFSSSSRLSA